MSEPLTLGGIPIVYDEMAPKGRVYLIARPAQWPGETREAYLKRMAEMSVVLVNIEGTGDE